MIIPFTKVGTLAIVGLELLFDWIPISTSILAKLRKVSVYHAYPGIGSLEQVCLLYLFFLETSASEHCVLFDHVLLSLLLHQLNFFGLYYC